MIFLNDKSVYISATPLVNQQKIHTQEFQKEKKMFTLFGTKFI